MFVVCLLLFGHFCCVLDVLGFLQSIRYHSVVGQGWCLTRLFYRSLSLGQERSATNKHKQGCLEVLEASLGQGEPLGYAETENTKKEMLFVSLLFL